MNCGAGRLVDTSRRFHAAWAASHQPARRPMRGSGDVGAGFCADKSEVTSNDEARTTLDRCRMITMFSPVVREISKTRSAELIGRRYRTQDWVACSWPHGPGRPQ